jgi:hypothetical protein
MPVQGKNSLIDRQQIGSTDIREIAGHPGADFRSGQPRCKGIQ